MYACHEWLKLTQPQRNTVMEMRREQDKNKNKNKQHNNEVSELSVEDMVSLGIVITAGVTQAQHADLSDNNQDVNSQMSIINYQFELFTENE